MQRLKNPHAKIEKFAVSVTAISNQYQWRSKGGGDRGGKIEGIPKDLERGKVF